VRRALPHLLALAGVLAAAAPAVAAPRLTPVGTFQQPVHVTAPPQDPNRLFVVEKAGVVKVVVDGGAPKTFLDIAGEVDETGEEGLLSIAFAADYASSRRFYAYFTATDPSQGAGSMIKVVEFTGPEATPDAADPAARRTLLEIPHPDFTNHNGGQLQVGPDGMLWIATGDGGSARDPGDDGQNPRSLLGKILRIDPAPSPTAPYSIPLDNPFANGAFGAREVWAYGLRNPWRFSFDRESGDLVIADVGQGNREEVDLARRGEGAGANYGWRCYEGSLPTPGVPPCEPPGHVRPVFEYDSSPLGFGCAITGGYVVRDRSLPSLFGRYLYGDYCEPRLRSLVLGQPAASGDRAEESLALDSVVSFGEDSCGHLYVTSLGGTVARVDEDAFTPCRRADDAPPGLALSRSRRQRLIARRAATVAATCSEACGLTADAHVRVRVRSGTRRYRFERATRFAPARERTRFVLRLSKTMRRAVAKRLARGERPLAKVSVAARDPAGNETVESVYVRVVG
jgi:glucose/arabinose dehydrogenase